jgi:hypothetical protein
MDFQAVSGEINHKTSALDEDTLIPDEGPIIGALLNKESRPSDHSKLVDL